VCAFPGCTHRIINDKHQFIAEVCHIEAAAPGGERHNASQPEAERREPRDPVSRHHVETDDVTEWPTDRMKAMKASHEARFTGSEFAPDADLVKTVSASLHAYWDAVDVANKFQHASPDFKINVDTSAGLVSLFRSLREAAKWINDHADAVSQDEDKLVASRTDAFRKLGITPEMLERLRLKDLPYQNYHFEALKLGIPNWVATLSMMLDQAEILSLSYYVTLHPKDSDAAKRLTHLKDEFLHSAKTASLAD
jgi:hypothetical protein